MEAHNHAKSGKAPEPLSVALMALYKKDMWLSWRVWQTNVGISTTYMDRTPAAREKWNKHSNAAQKKRQQKDKDDAQGPPDHKSDFKKPRCVVFTTVHVLVYKQCTTAHHLS